MTFEELERLRFEQAMTLGMLNAARESARRMARITGNVRNNAFSAKVLELESECEKLKTAVQDAEKEMTSQINLITDEMTRNIVLMCGLEGQSWRNICAITWQSPTQCRKIFRAGLKEMGEI